MSPGPQARPHACPASAAAHPPIHPPINPAPLARSQEPASAEVSEVFEGMKDLGVLMGKGGLYGNVFRVKPPMCFSRADADFLVDVMDHCLSRL